MAKRKKKNSLLISILTFVVALGWYIVDDINNQPVYPSYTYTNNIAFYEFNEKDFPEFYAVLSKVDEAIVNDLEKLEKGEAIYYDFDEYGRATGVIAKIDYSMFEEGKKERKDISSIKPSGFVNNKEVKIIFYDKTIYNGAFYNRSHLLAHSLGGKDEAINLITGTRAQNVGKNDLKGGMQYGERKAYEYIESHPKSYVLYSVIPNYKESEKVARQVIINIKSEDNSINEQIVVFNVAPGYDINYQTGEYKKIN